jgi:hypothetical protein
MFDWFEISTTKRRDWITFAFLMLAFLLPTSGLVGVLVASSSEAEVEFFGEEEIEECLVVAQRNKTGRRKVARPKRHVQSRVVVSRTHHSDVCHERVISGHRYTNGLLAPIRC